MGKITKTITSICTPAIPMKAVYYDKHERSCFRKRIICIESITETEEDAYHEETDSVSYIRMVAECKHYPEAADEDNNFLGYEYNNEEEDWSDEISSYLKYNNR